MQRPRTHEYSHTGVGLTMSCYGHLTLSLSLSHIMPPSNPPNHSSSEYEVKKYSSAAFFSRCAALAIYKR